MLLWLYPIQVELAQSQPASKPTAGVTASNKVEQRRLQMLVRQREQLEQELRELENEVLDLVGFCRHPVVWVDGADCFTRLTSFRRPSKEDDLLGSI